jgi:NAD(P)-dependent dehydrogenase (short-subunit alcohol dehydrogenase family)
MGRVETTMSGKVAVVTGATGGIGKEIARGLVRLGADVVVGARDPRRGEATRAELTAAPGGGGVSVLPLDVADQSSVRAFAAAFTERRSSLDVLVNNAGAWFTDRRVSPDGHELTLATNVLGPHLLTELLLDSLRSAPSARVVNVVSSIVGDYDATDLQFTRRRYDGYKAYAQSKQALTMLTWGLAGRLAGQGVCANTAAPGFVRTGFNRNARGPRTAMINLMVRLFAVSPAKGADTPLWAASAPELDGVTGTSFAARKEHPPKFTGAGPIAELERLCGDLEAATG